MRRCFFRVLSLLPSRYKVAKQKDSWYDIREMQAPLIVPSSEATQEIVANQPNTVAVHVRLQPGLGLNNGQGNLTQR